jgi:hypothetical protein
LPAGEPAAAKPLQPVPADPPPVMLVPESTMVLAYKMVLTSAMEPSKPLLVPMMVPRIL